MVYHAWLAVYSGIKIVFSSYYPKIHSYELCYDPSNVSRNYLKIIDLDRANEIENI